MATRQEQINAHTKGEKQVAKQVAETKCHTQEQQPLRPMINLPVVKKGIIVPTKWLLDTGSEISIYTEFADNYKNKKQIRIQGVNTERTVPVIEIIIQCYDAKHKIEVASFSAPLNSLGIKEIIPNLLELQLHKEILCKFSRSKN